MTKKTLGKFEVKSIEEVALFFTGALDDPRFTVPRQVDVAEFFNVSLATVRSWAIRRKPMPGEPGAYPLSRIAGWLYSPAGPRARQGAISGVWGPER